MLHKNLNQSIRAQLLACWIFAKKNASSKTHRCWLKFLQMLPHILVWSLAIHSPFTLSLFLSSSPSPPQLAFSSSHIWPPQFFTSFQKQLHPLPTSWRVVKKMFSSGYIIRSMDVSHDNISSISTVPDNDCRWQPQAVVSTLSSGCYPIFWDFAEDAHDAGFFRTNFKLGGASSRALAEQKTSSWRWMSRALDDKFSRTTVGGWGAWSVPCIVGFFFTQRKEQHFPKKNEIKP